MPVEFAPDTSELEAGRYRLRLLREADRDGFLSALSASRESLDRTMPLHEPGWTDEDVFERQLAWTIEGHQRGTALRRVIHDPVAGRIMGMANLIKIERGLSHRAEVSVWVRPDAAGRGIATSALAAVVDDAFDDLPRGQQLHQISGWRLERNRASERIFEKLGFLKTGDQPQAMHAGGRWEPHLQYMITVDRWVLHRDRVA